MNRIDELENDLADLIAAHEIITINMDRTAKELERLRIERAADELLKIPDPETLGENMTTSKLLATALDRQDLGVRRSFLRLDAEERQRVEEQFHRHAAACNNLGIDPDPAFIREAIHDLLFVPPGEREETTARAVYELVNASYLQNGGEGETEVEILR